ncbi:FdhD protein [Friedmanniella endophytica]|uniref:Sulfur carrier protein FdhD n=1 Tax=Microlunatus kandeliicorticis TaxID=1759536 RepID=A0A7W3IS44_9ACTN|nr:formate dehydrogenase accessory sulfurtransferase FdhD [Microlunatus kandeliicorticis]MBA8794226.1 FdhD protein [Microlunatus kandeliicorticis]
MAQVSRRRPVRHLAGEVWSRRSDRLAVEEPLEIRIGGEPFSVTMRTPGEDFELVLGYLYGEGIVVAAGDVRALRYCLGTGPDGLNTYNVIDAALADGVPAPEPGLRRNVLTSSACGICGTTSIDTVLDRTRPALLPDGPVLPVETLRRLPDRLREHQAAFERTGGLHAAGLARVDADGAAELLCVREDVGRHNAVDKVVGWALGQDAVPAADTVLVVSGRASFELTQKAVQAGIGVLAAVSAPSTLAVELAERAGLTLAGFVRGETLNVYSHPHRVTGP